MSEGAGEVLCTGSGRCSDVPPADQATVARMRSVFASLWEFVLRHTKHTHI